MLAVYYMYSILIFMILDFGIVNMFPRRILSRMSEIAYVTGQDMRYSIDKEVSPINLFIIYGLPVVRLLITFMLFYLATCSDESFDELLDALRNAQNKWH